MKMLFELFLQGRLHQKRNAFIQQGKGIMKKEYDFSKFYDNTYGAGPGFVLPSMSPAVFELKNPTQNVKGIIR